MKPPRQRHRDASDGYCGLAWQRPNHEGGGRAQGCCHWAILIFLILSMIIIMIKWPVKRHSHLGLCETRERLLNIDITKPWPDVHVGGPCSRAPMRWRRRERHWLLAQFLMLACASTARQCSV